MLFDSRENIVKRQFW